MLVRILVAAVVLLHFGFIGFVAVGALPAWRWPRLAWLHLPAAAWGVGTVTVGFPCPLTALEKTLWRWAGANAYPGGFVDRYIEGVIYPEQFSAGIRAVILVMTLAAYLGLCRRSMKVAGPSPS